VPANQTKSPDATETAARILLYDLETSPNLAYTWGVWQQDVIRVIKHRQIISFAWKWLGEAEGHVLALPDFKGYAKDKENNRELIKALHALFCQADITVGHNVVDFDDKRSNTDFIKHGLTPPPPHKRVDTLKAARAAFDFNSNKLDDLGEFLGVGRKVRHPGIDMWIGCLNGDPESWAQMKKYNLGDVGLLERVYLKLRPWMTGHPNLNPMSKASFTCPACKSANLQCRGFIFLSTGKRQRYQCTDCGKWATGRFGRYEGQSRFMIR